MICQADYFLQPCQSSKNLQRKLAACCHTSSQSVSLMMKFWKIQSHYGPLEKKCSANQVCLQIIIKRVSSKRSFWRKTACFNKTRTVDLIPHKQLLTLSVDSWQANIVLRLNCSFNFHSSHFLSFSLLPASWCHSTLRAAAYGSSANAVTWLFRWYIWLWRLMLALCSWHQVPPLSVTFLYCVNVFWN